MYVTASVAPPATRHLSGPCLDPNWEFDRGKSVRVLLQVRGVAVYGVCLWCVCSCSSGGSSVPPVTR
jgi:hypothetical protein